MNDVIAKLDALYGQLAAAWDRGDLSLEDLARYQVEGLRLLAEILSLVPGVHTTVVQ